MQYGDYIEKMGKETKPEELALMAREMAETIARVEKEKTGCIVESAEIIIKEHTIGWKVALLEPGEKRMMTEEKKRAMYMKIAQKLKG